MNDVKVGFGAIEPLAAEMTLRDWYAGQAMARYSCLGAEEPNADSKLVAEWCLDDADAMMARRAQRYAAQKVAQNPPPA